MAFNTQKQERTKEAQNIRDTIKRELSYLRQKYPRREEYVPKDVLPLWVTSDAIGKWVETSNIDPVDGKKLKQQICTLALKTFCILIGIEKEDSIQYFIQRSDSGGPDIKLYGMTETHLKVFLKEADRNVASSWDKEKCEEFCSTAWKYVPVEFTPDLDHVILPEEAVLPFCMREPGDSQMSAVDFDAQYLRSATAESKAPKVVCQLMAYVLVHTLIAVVDSNDEKKNQLED